jgi:hypothetical protein
MKLQRDLYRWIHIIEGSSDLVQELTYRVSEFEELEDSTLLHFELPITEVLIWLGLSDQGRDSQPSISPKVGFWVSGFEELKDSTLLHFSRLPKSRYG